MGLRQCSKCNEMVDEAKAFCPGCGHAFVDEEQRREASEFDRSDKTVQFSETMFGSMLSDMGLDISKAPNPDGKNVETISPAQAEVITPVVAVVEPLVITPDSPEPVGNSKMKWFIWGGVILVFLFLFVLAAAVLVFMFWSRLR